MIELVFGLVAVGMFMSGVRLLCFCATRACSPLTMDTVPQMIEDYNNPEVQRAQKKINKGTAALDEKFGMAWPQKIDLRALNIAGDRSCILGQLRGSYREHISQLAGVGCDVDEYGEEHGLYVPNADDGMRSVEYNRLSRMWRREIAGRQLQLQTA